MRLMLRKLHDVPEPRRAKLQVPGWSGERTHDVPQPWHCKPFSDAAGYGLEILFGWKTACNVSLKRGRPVWSGDLEAELPSNAPPGWRPFSVFSPGHFGFSPLMDLQVPDGMGLFVLPHPRCLMDTSGTAPLAIPGLMETHWWPRPFFLVFKAPAPRKVIEFRYGDPIAQILVVPLREKYQVVEMDAETAQERNRRSITLAENGVEFSTRVTHSTDGYPSFDNKYKVLAECARTCGIEEVQARLDRPGPGRKRRRTPERKQNPTEAARRTAIMPEHG